MFRIRSIFYKISSIFNEKKLYNYKITNSKKGLEYSKSKFLRFKVQRNSTYPLNLEDINMKVEFSSKVSVILPVYNGEEYLAESIQSVLDQTYEDFELIIVNDGSTDKTLEIAKTFERKDKRIKIINQENRKIPLSLNHGFNEASGEFFTWTSSDNIMEINFLETMVRELEDDPECAMVYANMKIINENGNLLHGHFWYEYPSMSANVMLPDNTQELNILPNNTIGAAFMYKKVAALGVLGYSKIRYGIEDYDYWMKINSLFKIKHINFQTPIYSYRMHKNSLTSRDFELKITENRYKLMVFDDARRDFYLSKLVWVVDDEIDTDNLESPDIKFQNFIDLVKKNHVLLTKSELNKLETESQLENLCFINFKTKELVNNERKNYMNIKISGNVAKFFSNFDNIKREDFLGQNLFFESNNSNSIFSYLDILAKNSILQNFEAKIESDKNHIYKLSIIVCTYNNSKGLYDCLRSLYEQNYSDPYEIIVVENNKIPNQTIEQTISNLRNIYPEISLIHIFCPIQGLSYARNAGFLASKGKYLLYIDDDAIADKNLIKETIENFDKSDEIGVIGGQIILKYDTKPDVLNDSTASLWSEFKIENTKVIDDKDYGSFPYGANFAIRKSALLLLGGFRTSYGRCLENSEGGEETVICFLMRNIKMKVYLNPNSIVYHNVNPNRYTNDHIKKTAYLSVMTNYRLKKDLYSPNDWTESYILEKIINLEKNIIGLDPNTPEFIKINSEILAYREVLKNMKSEVHKLNLR